MPGKKFWLGVLAFLLAAFAVHFVLSSDKALVVQPKGIMAHEQLKLIQTNILLMLCIVIPTLIVLFLVAWRYREKNQKAEHQPKAEVSTLGQWLLWIVPTFVIAIMAYITLPATFKLDPFRPLKSDVKPLQIQVVAIDWKWLFIYPELGIATLNFVQIPEKTPINLSLSADGSPMNSFWVPQLSGQIYCMTGMVTPLHIMADGVGEYRGKAAEINGAGYATMTFKVKSSSTEDFQTWINEVKQSKDKLDAETYEALLTPSMHDPVTLYSHVEDGLFHSIIMKYMPPNHHRKK